METIKVYSTVEDKNIKNELNASPIWAHSFTIDELTEAIKKHPILYEYTIKFEGTKPIFISNIKKFK